MLAPRYAADALPASVALMASPGLITAIWTESASAATPAPTTTTSQGVNATLIVILDDGTLTHCAVSRHLSRDVQVGELAAAGHPCRVRWSRPPSASWFASPCCSGGSTPPGPPTEPG